MSDTGFSGLRRHSALGLGFIAQALQYGAGLIVLPFVVTRLAPAEIGLWYLFLTVQSLAFLADFGFQPTLARAFASAYAGASELRKRGHGETSGEPNLPLIQEILYFCRRLYLALAGVVVLLLLAAGLVYFCGSTADEQPDVVHNLLVWAILSVGTASQLYFSWTYSFLTGAGRISASYGGQIVSRMSFVAIGIGVLVSGFGLPGLALANLSSIIVGRAYAAYSMRPLFSQLVSSPPRHEKSRDTFKALWPNATRMGLVTLGAFLITRANLMIISAFLGLATTAAYALSLQLLMAVVSIAQLPMQIAAPMMVQMRVHRNILALRRVFITRQAMLLALLIVGLLFIVVAGPWLLALIGSNVQLLPTGILLLLGLVLLLEANHSACALVITTGNEVPFVVPALVSGLAVVVLGTFAAAAGYGVAGVILAQGLVQLAYNNWKWPLQVWKELHGKPVQPA
jgi:O-antigen/teichoic acid export membrane protein